MRAAKGNKEYMIDGSQQTGYQDSGFDILDDDGTVIAYGKGKTVPFDEHMLAVKENECLQKLCADLQKKKAELEKELDELKKPDKKAPVKKAGE